MNEINKTAKIKDCFLLSSEEYEKYKDKIKNIHSFWRLSSAGEKSYYTCGVNHDCVIDRNYWGTNDKHSGIRMALSVLNCEDERIKIGGWTFSKLDKSIYLSDTINFYDYFDNLSTDYKKSHIQKRLQNEILPLLQNSPIEVIE